MPTAGLRVDGDLDRAQQQSQRRGARARHPGDRLDLDGNRLPHEGARGDEEGHIFPPLGSDRVIVSDRNSVETTQLPQHILGAPWYQDFVTCFSVLPLHCLILASLLAPSLPSAGLGGHPHLCVAPGLSHPSAQGVHAFDLKKAPDPGPIWTCPWTRLCDWRLGSRIGSSKEPQGLGAGAFVGSRPSGNLW